MVLDIEINAIKPNKGEILLPNIILAASSIGVADVRFFPPTILVTTQATNTYSIVAVIIEDINAKGIGLGLYICKKIANKLGG